MLVKCYRMSTQRHPFGNLPSEEGYPWKGMTNKETLTNFLSVFGKDNVVIFCDNLDDETFEFVKSTGVDNLHRTSLGNVGSLNYLIDYVLQSYHEDDSIYIVEDDYLHLLGSPEILEEGLELADYVSLYDSLDKYIEGGNNPLIKGRGEVTKVILSKSSHWKYTNATTGTFAFKVRTLKRDLDLFRKYNNSSHKHMQDFAFFQEIINSGRGTLINSIPGRSAHIGLEMSPFIDWFNFDKDTYNIL